ncbi:helix-turn-helix transcriptional regulator [Streptomyces sp. NPDC050560]|uniref:helix-turn-helix transcriptional regulator n=1 Tax=Streptomyces sp. NPDC050560 TaxID=3365630 RepID=UPI00379BC358
MELVGRQREMAELGDVLARARLNHGTAVFVMGEPGVGKTRLCTEAVGIAADTGMAVLKGRCTVTGPAVPYRPLTEALLSLARDGARAPVAALGPYRPVLGRLVPEWSTGEKCDESPVVLAEAVLRLTSALGAGRGCLLVVDDLHDADPETLAVVEYLSANVAAAPVAVLATARSAPSPAAELASAVAQRGEGAVLPLDRLAADDTHRLAAACLGCPPDDLPAEVSERVLRDSGGIPFVAQELVRGMRAGGELRHADGRWRLDPAARSPMPFTLVRAVEQRAERLGPEGLRMLSAAAVLGRIFPLSVVRECAGLGEEALLGCLRSAVAEGLLLPDERGPDWYAFEHPLAEEALRSRLTPVDRAALCARAADAVAALHPGLPGTWCELAARLRRHAGDRTAAADLYLEVARRALAGSGPGTAIAVLDEALRMLGAEGQGPQGHDRRDLLETLLFALADDGQFDRAAAVAARLRRIDVATQVDLTRRVDLHVRLARAAEVAGRWEEGLGQVAAARALLPPGAGKEDTAPVDAVEAYLTVSGPERGGIARSEELARRAIEGAERRADPALACQGWYAVGFASRARSLGESDACFRRTLRIATDHHLVTWRNHGLIGIGNNAWLAEGDATGLVDAHREALRTGCVSLAHNAAAMLGFDAVLRSRFERATVLLDGVVEETSRLKLYSVARHALMLRSVAHAHRADRQGMRAALAEFRALGGEQSREAPLVLGLAELFCALLEEDHEAAASVAAALGTGQPREGFFHFSGIHGLVLLLGVLRGRAGWTEYDTTHAAQAGRMRWNRQFVGLAEAVLLGREGRAADASAALAAALRSAEIYPTARHLGLRLVADVALADGWGEPRRWLAESEGYFHRTGATAVAAACRARLRSLGVHVGQRRSGTERIPDELRTRGVTAREFDVFRLLTDRLGNKEIAARLHISDRTVEKHVASLIGKTGVRGRGKLCSYASELIGARTPGRD